MVLGALQYVSRVLIRIIRPDNPQNVRDGGWNVVGKQLSSPKTFNSWAVIDFVADKLDMNQIRDRVRALSSCCQQLGKSVLRMQHKTFC
jgi:hypothetical protein